MVMNPVAVPAYSRGRHFQVVNLRLLEWKKARNWSGHQTLYFENENGTHFGSGVRGNQEQLKALFEKDEAPKWATLRYFGRSSDNIPRPVVIDYGFEASRND